MLDPVPVEDHSPLARPPAASAGARGPRSGRRAPDAAGHRGLGPRARRRARGSPGRTPVIRFEGFTKRFGGHAAVEALTFGVEPGEAVALLGPNGSGKTTTLKGAAGLVRPTSGRVFVGEPGRDASEPAARRAISYLPQRVSFPEALTGLEVVEFYRRLRGAARRAQRRGPAPGVLERRFGPARSSTYSGGMIQRLGLAVAALPDTPVLLLDEPTAALDPDGLCAFYGLVERRRREGRTLLFTSHQLGDVERLADRFLLLVGGRLAASLSRGGALAAARLPRRHASLARRAGPGPARAPCAPWRRRRPGSRRSSSCPARPPTGRACSTSVRAAGGQVVNLVGRGGAPGFAVSGDGGIGGRGTGRGDRETGRPEAKSVRRMLRIAGSGGDRLFRWSARARAAGYEDRDVPLLPDARLGREPGRAARRAPARSRSSSTTSAA